MEQNGDLGFSVKELTSVIYQQRRLICAIVGAATICAVIYSLVAPKTYKAKAVIMPIVQNSSSGVSSLLSQLAGGGQLAGLVGSNQSPLNKFIIILDSRTLAETVIKKMKLMPVLVDSTNDSNMEAAVQKFHGHVKVGEGKKRLGVIEISAEFGSPELAANVVNGTISALQDFISNNTVTLSKRNRIFIENQLIENKKLLLESGKNLNNFYKADSALSVGSKIDVPIDEDVARLSSVNDLDKVDQVADQNREMDTASKQLSSKRVVRQVPQQVYLEYLKMQGQSFAQINMLLAQQYEMAKIDESREDLAFQVIDFAHIPERRENPKRVKIVLTAMVCSVFLALCVVLIRARRGCLGKSMLLKDIE